MSKQITAYQVGGPPMEIRRAPHTRDWMDETREKYAYRCLPLVVANTYGWELLCPEEFSATWNGQTGLDAITIVPKVDFALSHFGYGILTFHVPYLFRTSEDADLLVSGPVNRCKENAVALEGIVETSWSTMTFTMNWQLTTRLSTDVVTFEKDEPFCRIVPVSRNFLDGWEARIVASDDVPKKILTEYQKWNNSRGEFLDKLHAGDPETTRAGWQRTYYKSGKVTKLPEFIL